MPYCASVPAPFPRNTGAACHTILRAPVGPGLAASSQQPPPHAALKQNRGSLPYKTLLLRTLLQPQPVSLSNSSQGFLAADVLVPVPQALWGSQHIAQCNNAPLGPGLAPSSQPPTPALAAACRPEPAPVALPEPGCWPPAGAGQQLQRCGHSLPAPAASPDLPAGVRTDCASASRLCSADLAQSWQVWTQGGCSTRWRSMMTLSKSCAADIWSDDAGHHTSGHLQACSDARQVHPQGLSVQALACVAAKPRADLAAP